MTTDPAGTGRAGRVRETARTGRADASPAGGRDDVFVLRGGTVIDGTGQPPRPADVLITAGRVAAVDPPGTRTPQPGDLDCRGLHILPGFVDAHSHADFTLPTRPDADGLLRQGVTTVVTGNCGFSPFPVVTGEPEAPPAAGAFLNLDLTRAWPDLSSYADFLTRAGLRVNVAPLVGHGSIRAGVLGPGGGPADPAQRDRISAEVSRALAQGAAGVSLGLAYPEGRDADATELASVARITAAAGGVLATHVRDERAGCVDAVREVLRLTRRTGVATQISHLKAMGRANWGGTRDTLGLIDAARARGLDVTIDMYPYTAGATTLAAALPSWADAGGGAGIRRLLADPSARDRLLRELPVGAGYVSLDEVVLAHTSPRWRDLRGRPLVRAAAERGVPPAALLLDVLATDGDRASMLVDAMTPADVDRVLDHPAAMVGSDGWVLRAAPEAHPRNFATFVRTLVRAGRDPRNLAEAVRRQTAAVADRFRLAGRGRIARGCWADLVVLDLEALDEGGGFADPAEPPGGVRQVFVNGMAAYGDHIGAPGGRVLRRSSEPSERR